MRLLLITGFIALLFSSCTYTSPRDEGASPASFNSMPGEKPKAPPHSIGNIPLPEGFKRVEVPPNSFAEWLRLMPLKKLNKVYLYNKQLKPEQHHHYAVLDISTGDRDLQQCADALMRLRAEYLFSAKAYDQIYFFTGNGTRLGFKEFAAGERFTLRNGQLVKYYVQPQPPCYTHNCLMEYLHVVFSYCSTYSLTLQTTPVPAFDVALGDMLVKPGSPGHAMMVSDVAVNSEGKKVYLLIQSFMPAQDMHIVNNLQNSKLSPWYIAGNQPLIVTPGYTFTQSHLRRWKK